ncbi:unnamed protein product, partial [Nesidiocoris tenuis]
MEFLDRRKTESLDSLDFLDHCPDLHIRPDWLADHRPIRHHGPRPGGVTGLCLEFACLRSSRTRAWLRFLTFGKIDFLCHEFLGLCWTGTLKSRPEGVSGCLKHSQTCDRVSGLQHFCFLGVIYIPHEFSDLLW